MLAALAGSTASLNWSTSALALGFVLVRTIGPVESASMVTSPAPRLRLFPAGSVMPDWFVIVSGSSRFPSLATPGRASPAMTGAAVSVMVRRV